MRRLRCLVLSWWQVGPGTGNLTKHLLAAGALVTAVEKDDVLYERLSNTYSKVQWRWWVIGSRHH